jgi:ribonuclease HI
MEVIIFTDGGARGNPGVAGCGAVVLDNQAKTLTELSKPIGLGTNNEAEYQGVLLSLTWVEDQTWQAADKLTFKLDSLWWLGSFHSGKLKNLD